MIVYYVLLHVMHGTTTMAWTLSAFSDEAGISIDEQISVCKKVRLNRIDLRKVDGQNICMMPFYQAGKTKKKLESVGIEVDMFGTSIGKIDVTDDFRDEINMLQRIGTMSQIFHCKAVRIFSYYNKTGLDRDHWQQIVIDRLRRLTDIADELGLVLYHENERGIFGSNYERILILADLFRGHTPFKLIFDFDNYNRQDIGDYASWSYLRDKTDSFHLKDAAADKKHVLIGQGRSQAKRILTEALQGGWTGSLSVEPHLWRSEMPVPTGNGETQRQKFKDLPLADSFQLAVTAARNLLNEIGASFS